MAVRRHVRTTRALARFLSSIFFREVLVEGTERIPAEGPLIFAVNHPNSLVDPLVIHGMLPRNPQFLAKSTLWDNPFVRPFLQLAGSIPVYRSQDKDAPTARNIETFDACYRALADNAAIGIFPEGMSHTEPSLLPIKTGIARIVLGAEERYGPLGIRIVPVGLTFEEGHVFRSRVLVTVGEPLDAIGDVPAERGAFRRLRNDVTRKVDHALRNVTLNFQSRREARLLARAGDLYAKSPSELPDRPALNDLVAIRRQFAEGYEVVKKRSPGLVASVARKVDAYDRMLRATGFSDEQVVSSYPAGQVVSYVIRTAGRLLMYVPLALVGTVLNWIPYRITALVAERHNDQLQNPATYKILGGLFIYPALWFFQACAAGLFIGWRTALAMAALSPLTGYIAMRFHEDSEVFRTQALNYLRLRSHRQIWQELGKRRNELAGEIAALVHRYLDEREESSPASGP